MMKRFIVAVSISMVVSSSAFCTPPPTDPIIRQQYMADKEARSQKILELSIEDMRETDIDRKVQIRDEIDRLYEENKRIHEEWAEGRWNKKDDDDDDPQDSGRVNDGEEQKVVSRRQTDIINGKVDIRDMTIEERRWNNGRILYIRDQLGAKGSYIDAPGWRTKYDWRKLLSGIVVIVTTLLWVFVGAATIAAAIETSPIWVSVGAIVLIIISFANIVV